jgi:hypothetical protein
LTCGRSSRSVLFRVVREFCEHPTTTERDDGQTHEPTDGPNQTTDHHLTTHPPKPADNEQRPRRTFHPSSPPDTLPDGNPDYFLMYTTIVDGIIPARFAAAASSGGKEFWTAWKASMSGTSHVLAT